MCAQTIKKTSYFLNKYSAFSLIEVVIATAIFAVATTILVSTFVNSLLARESAISNSLVDTDIRAVRMQILLEPDIEAAQVGNEYKTLNSGEVSWEAVIDPTNVVDLFKVKFLVKFQNPPEGQIAQYTETLYLLRPSWSESDERDKLLQDKRDILEDIRRNYQF